MNNCTNCIQHLNCAHSHNPLNCPNSDYYITGDDAQNVIEVTNNQSRYYAELAEKYKNEAKELRDSAQYYAEQNSDVTKSYVDGIDAVLRNLIAAKQDSGNYALASDIPTKISDLQNDISLIDSSGLNSAISAQALQTTSEINQKVAERVNLDFTNLSAVGKSNFIKLACELDYDNAILVSSANTSANPFPTYTCPDDGLFIVRTAQAGGNSNKIGGVILFLNGNDVSGICLQNQNASTGSTSASVWWGFSKDDVVTYYTYQNGAGTNYNYSRAHFIPFKKDV